MRIGRLQEVHNRFRLIFANRQHAQAITMFKVEMRKVWYQLAPQLVDAKPAFGDNHIVKKDYASFAHFWQSGVIVVFHRLIGMQTVYVEQIHGMIGNLLQGFIKRHPQQF